MLVTILQRKKSFEMGMKPWTIIGILAVCLLAVEARSQCRSFELSDRGDTLNCTDVKGRRQGKWVVKIPELRGNPGYEEEGMFIDDKKEGIWRKYTTEGDLMAVETYKWGLLNGKSQYYSVMGMEREESWWAMDPSKKYDTIDVPDLEIDGLYKRVVIENEMRSLKHGTWTWYEPTTGFIKRTEEFIRDSSVSPLAAFGIKSKTPSDTTGSNRPPKTEKPSVVQEFEKKNSGKKKVKVRDGSTGY
jgi:antitoxin component YwqK of YwqJK toxin-antitoxin module